MKKAKKRHTYIIKNKSDCINCKNYIECTNSKKGRRITRLEAEVTKEMLAALYETDRAKEIYKQRKEKVELPFGHIKSNSNDGAMLMRGISGANAEMAINCTCFNISRMITLLGGVSALISIIKINKSTEYNFKKIKNVIIGEISIADALKKEINPITFQEYKSDIINSQNNEFNDENIEWVLKQLRTLKNEQKLDNFLKLI